MIPTDMERAISHGREEETPEAKARWFQSLPIDERMELLCAFTNFFLERNPKIPELRNARSPAGRVRVLSAT
jgi:hypothetical protein